MTTREAPAPVVHVVVAGEVGGAERMVARLALAVPHPGDAVARRHLIALWSDAPAVRALFTGAGVEVVTPPRLAGRGGGAGTLMGATGGRDVAWLASVLRATGAGAVQLHTFASHILGTRAGRLAGVPVIRTEHSTRVYDHWLCRPFSSWSLRRAAAVVAVSDCLRRQIVTRSPEVGPRIAVIRNGVPWMASAPAPRGDGPLRIGLVARLEPRKGVDRALAALARIAGAESSVVLDIVGDGPGRAALVRQAAALGVADRARFWGYRSDPQTVVAETDAVLCSSRTEGMPVALLEAMMLGRPVIAVPVGGVPEIVIDGETGWLAPDPSIDALAATLAAALRLGRGEMARRGAQARRVAERDFTEPRMRAAYERLYQSLPGPVPNPFELAPAIKRASAHIAR